MKFSDNLRNLRREKEYSQEYLAERLGVTRQTISKWENGTAMPDLKKLTEIAELFGTTMDKLLGTEKEASTETKYNNVIQYSIAESNQSILQKRVDKLKIVTIVMAVICVISITTSISTQNELSNLSSKVDNIVQNAGSTDDQSDNTATDVLSDYVSVKIDKADKDKPNIVTATFTYSPETYSNDTKVSFSIPDAKDGKKIIDAKKESDEFKATATFDITAGDNYAIRVNDGKSTALYDLDNSFYTQYIAEPNNGEDANTMSVTIESQLNKHTYSLSDGKNTTSTTLSWDNKNSILSIKSAELVAEDSLGVKLKSIPLEIRTNGNKSYAVVDEITTDSVADILSIKLTAKDGTVYEKRFATGDVDTDGDDNSTKITFKNGKSITEYE